MDQKEHDIHPIVTRFSRVALAHSRCLHSSFLDRFREWLDGKGWSPMSVLIPTPSIIIFLESQIRLVPSRPVVNNARACGPILVADAYRTGSMTSVRKGGCQDRCYICQWMMVSSRLKTTRVQGTKSGPRERTRVSCVRFRQNDQQPKKSQTT